MRRFFLIIILIMTTVFFGCFGNQAQEWYQTAELEEIQNSHEHARKLYLKILDKYPQSEYAQKARDRLAVMDQKKTQAGSG